MKKTIIIAIGTILILVVIAVWAYLFIYGTPQSSDEVFARFGLGKDATPVVAENNPSDSVGVETVGAVKQKLKQLTTRPVAGAAFTGNGIVYVEQGTGHIHHLNLSSGSESLISGTTIAGAREAYFSPRGTHVAIARILDGVTKTIVGGVPLEGGGNLEGVSLPDGASQIQFDSTGDTLYYALKDSSGTSGYSYAIEGESGGRLFQIPLRHIRLLWGTPMYVYTTPTATQEGYLYKISGGNLEYVANGGFGLLGFRTADEILITKHVGDKVLSYAITPSKVLDLPLSLIPEKCVEAGASLYCAVPDNIPNSRYFPDNWYKGVVSLSDALWNVNVLNGEATLVSDFLSESGREVDVRAMGANEAGTAVYFINKNDNTLWMYDMTE
jgi:hypothetical protein